MQLNQPGFYRCTVSNWGVNDSRQDKPPFFQLEFECRQIGEIGEVDGKRLYKWTNIAAVGSVRDDMYPRIVADYYPYKNDNSVSDFTWNNLCTVLGWDGKTMQTLHESDFSKVKCVIVVENETYEKNGAQRTALKVKWLNLPDSQPVGGRTIKKTSNASGLAKWGLKPPVKSDIFDLPPPNLDGPIDIGDIPMTSDDVPF